MKLLHHEILWLVTTLTVITAVFMIHAFVRYCFKFVELYRGEKVSSDASSEKTTA
jgi:hypothetical protein